MFDTIRNLRKSDFLACPRGPLTFRQKVARCRTTDHVKHVRFKTSKCKPISELGRQTISENIRYCKVYIEKVLNEFRCAILFARTASVDFENGRTNVHWWNYHIRTMQCKLILQKFTAHYPLYSAQWTVHQCIQAVHRIIRSFSKPDKLALEKQPCAHGTLVQFFWANKQ